MKGHSAFGEYWKDVHNSLIDLARQVGAPSLSWTSSPHEYIMSYHAWIQDEMSKSFRARLHLPAAESLHMAHTLTQIVHGILTGTNMQTASRKDRQWQKHILSAKDDKAEPVKLVVFTRMEFQDGTHKEGKFRYVGSGRPHLHVLIFSDELDRVKLEEFVSAAAPLEEVLRGKVLHTF